MFHLTAAIGALPQAVVTFQTFIPSEVQRAGHVSGTWSEWETLRGRVSVSLHSAPTRSVIANGGEAYMLALTVYCKALVAAQEDPPLPAQDITLILPRSRSCRVQVKGVVYQVMEVRVWPDTSDHAEVRCANVQGDAR